MDNFLRLLIGLKFHQHQLIQKASEQTMTSFVKNEYVPEIIPKLDTKIMS